MIESAEYIRNMCTEILQLLGLNKEAFKRISNQYEAGAEVDEGIKKAQEKENKRKSNHIIYASESDVNRIYNTEKPDKLTLPIVLRFINTAKEIVNDRNMSTPYSENEIRKFRDCFEQLKGHAIFHMFKAVMPPIDRNGTDMKVYINELVNDYMSKTEIYILDKYFDGFVALENAIDCTKYSILLQLEFSNNKADLLESLIKNLIKLEPNSNNAELEEVKKLFLYICDMNIYEEMRINTKAEEKRLRNSLYDKINKYRDENPQKDFTDIFTAFMIFSDPLNLMFIMLDMLDPTEQSISIDIGK